MDQIDRLVKQAIKDIKSRVMSVADDIGNDIAEAIQVKFDHCVDAFYNDFDPVYYDRTFNTYSASNGENGVSSLYEVHDNGTGVSITAGINIDSSRLGDFYKDGVDYVFPRTWEQGIHGTIDTGGQMKQSPKSMMDQWFEGFKNSGHRLIVNKHLRRVGLTGSKKK